MAKGKITGGELSNPILQIPLGKPHVVQFKPDIGTKLSKEETKELLSSLEMLLVKMPVPDKLDYSQCISCKREISGSEVLFTIQMPETTTKQKAPDVLGVYQCIIAEVERDQAQGGAIVQVKDPLIKVPLELVQANIVTQAGPSTSVPGLFAAPGSTTGAGSSPAGLSVAGNPVGAGNPAVEAAFRTEDSDSGTNGSNPFFDVALRPSSVKPTPSKSFWEPLKKATKAISFEKYAEFINTICETGDVKSMVNPNNELNQLSGLARRRFLPFNDTDSYRTIKVLTEFFLLANCTIDLNDPVLISSGYLKRLSGNFVDTSKGEYTIPYLHIIRQRLRDLPIKPKDIGDLLNLFQGVEVNINGGRTTCYGLLQEKLTKPCGIELIWSYWHEEAMLVQAMNAISLRFQNRKQPGGGKDPLVNMAVAPLLPLNNLLWGYVQDEQHRLSVLRRAYEYDHHYGITLMGKAAPNVEGADSRSNFLQAFHSLLHRCTSFFKQVDDLTVQADGFPILNALRDVHLILSEGAHNQYGDLPWNARVEMLMQQWMLSRAEFREFLPSRTMVAYPEAWMGPLTTMNNMQGWTSNSPINFNTLAVFGENLLLAIRLVNWPQLTAEDAANWAIEYRNEIQGYIHAYNTVTGVDLTTTHPQTGKIDAQQPAVHLLHRAKAGSNGNGQAQRALAQ